MFQLLMVMAFFRLLEGGCKTSRADLSEALSELESLKSLEKENHRIEKALREKERERNYVIESMRRNWNEPGFQSYYQRILASKREYRDVWEKIKEEKENK